MARKLDQKSPWRRLLASDKGEQELNQVAIVLFSHFLRRQNQDFEISPLENGIWLGSKTLCLTFRSFASLKLLKEDVLRDLQNIVVVAPLLDSWSKIEIEKAIRARLRQSGWGQKQADRLPLQFWEESALLEIPLLSLHYLPERVHEGKIRLKRILSIRAVYDREIIKLNSAIQFVGMSVYKEEASAGIEIERIYIPLRVVPESMAEENSETILTDPLTLLTPGARHVILGDPGSGKSTLLRFLALAGLKPQLLQKYGTQKDDRLPILITLRRYAEELRSRPNLGLMDHAIETACTDFGIPLLDQEFFEYSLFAGQGLVFLDGIDELPDPALKLVVRDRVADLLRDYPGNTLIATSRIFGYDQESRLNTLGFSHHRVAKLTINNIETFVNEWYRARIPNRRERDRHARDLIRILQDLDSRAIRELAENPLLLTIICLVHRIDAELPDERVVLYQKCTETLLNTWHNWKFRRERESLSRNKIERRNRSRMEAIAYWMHASLEEGREEVRRAVVPADALLAFLTEYVRDTERPRDEKPHDLAEIFLRFVKERAGLLIEVGSGQYSFLHLTFQEYLAATHLRKTGETAGMAAIWPYVEQHCGDPKWHEVIRLLVGSLERPDSQRYLLERILPQRNEFRGFDRVLIAGGCLLDGVDAAEDMQEEILSALLFQAATLGSLDLLHRVLRLLRTWEERDISHRNELCRLANEIEVKVHGTNLEFGLALSLIALGWEDEEVFNITPALWDKASNEGKVYWNLCGSRPSSPQWLEAEESLLLSFFIEVSARSSGLNFASVVLASLVLSQPVPRFVHLLANIGLPGPFSLFPFHCAVVQAKSFLPRVGPAARGPRGLVRIRRLEEIRNLAGIRDLEEIRKLARVRDLEGSRRLTEFRDLDLDRYQSLSRALRRALDDAPDQRVDAWSLLIADQDFYGPLLDLVCNFLKLSPGPQWKEALRMRALPKVPQRITLTDPQTWAATQRAFLRNDASVTDFEQAASQLLLDAWLWAAHNHDQPAQSPFAKLASLTRSNDSPLLRIAHCIRDIAYGDSSRATDLKDMVNSEEPTYRRIFEAAVWR